MIRLDESIFEFHTETITREEFISREKELLNAITQAPNSLAKGVIIYEEIKRVKYKYHDYVSAIRYPLATKRKDNIEQIKIDTYREFQDELNLLFVISYRLLGMI